MNIQGDDDWVTSVYVTPDGKYVCINHNPIYAQNVHLCRQWARILFRDQIFVKTESLVEL